MAAFTSIAAATVAVGGSAAKGFLAGDAAKDAAREAGRLEIEQELPQRPEIRQSVAGEERAASVVGKSKNLDSAQPLRSRTGERDHLQLDTAA